MPFPPNVRIERAEKRDNKQSWTLKVEALYKGRAEAVARRALRREQFSKLKLSKVKVKSSKKIREAVLGPRNIYRIDLVVED